MGQDGRWDTSYGCISVVTGLYSAGGVTGTHDRRKTMSDISTWWVLGEYSLSTR